MTGDAMPDGSLECKLILADLAEIKIQLTRLQEEVSELKLDKAKRDGASDVLHLMFARIGVVVVGLFSLIGWILVGDHWTALKKLFQ
jgi:hypothetical protein